MLRLIGFTLMSIVFSLMFLIFLPFLAVFLKLLWNTVMSCIHLSGNEITYWQALKLSFFLFMIKILLNNSINISEKNK